MFCNKCGNQIPDGSSFCNSCGCAAGNTQNGFGGGAPFFTRKEYFKYACSDKAKKLIKSAKIVLLVCSLLLVATMVSSFMEAKSFFDEAYFEGDIRTVVERLEELSGQSFGYTEEQYSDLQSVEEEFKKELGMTFVEFIEVILYGVYVLMAVAAFIVIILCYLAIRYVGLASSITALVISFLFVGGLVAIGMTVAVLVFVSILRKEYKAYCENPFAFTTCSNEPDFSN